MPERLAEMFVSHKVTADLENIAGEFIPTTADLFPSVLTLTQSKAVFGLAVAKLSWMHVRSVVSHALGSAPKKGIYVYQFMQTTVIQNTTT